MAGLLTYCALEQCRQAAMRRPFAHEEWRNIS
jgi:hypothetical protein